VFTGAAAAFEVDATPAPASAATAKAPPIVAPTSSGLLRRGLACLLLIEITPITDPTTSASTYVRGAI
jgi:hypothetical protein